MAEAPDINVDELRRRARRRLIGAVVLALAAAVVVPMLLESDPKPLGEDVSVKIPAQDNAKFVNRLSDKGAKTSATEAAAKSEPVQAPAGVDSAAIPAMTPPPESSAVPPVSAPAATQVPAPKSSIARAEQKVLGAPVKPAATPAPAPSAVTLPSVAPAPVGNAATSAPSEAAKDATSDTVKDGFSVQLAAFADDKGANALANKLKRAAYPAYTEPLATSKGTLWRVRVGPYPSRDAAIEIRDKLKGEGHSGIVSAAK
jgi:DedD protein